MYERKILKWQWIRRNSKNCQIQIDTIMHHFFIHFAVGISKSNETIMFHLENAKKNIGKIKVLKSKLTILNLKPSNHTHTALTHQNIIRWSHITHSDFNFHTRINQYPAISIHMCVCVCVVYANANISC